MSHAYIFYGEDNLAVRNQALDFAKSLNCMESNESFCGKCLSCRTLDSRNNPDTIFVKGTKQKGIGVDDIRLQVLSEMSQKPFRYKYKIFIVENAETLTPAAQNALLKTIEEPASYGVFLFVSPHLHNFLPTVLSRCVQKNINLGEKVTLLVSDEIKNLGYEIAKKIVGFDVYDAFNMYKHFKELEKEDLKKLLDMLYFIFGEKITHATKTHEEVKKVWFNSISAISKTKKILEQNGNKELAIELMLNEMREGNTL